MAQRPLATGMPDAQFVGTDGNIAMVWRQFLTQLFMRTGGPVGGNIANAATVAQLEAETQQRQTGDAALSAGLATETARAETTEGGLRTGLANEAGIRTSEDMRLEALIGQAGTASALAAETAARIAADALLVPIAQLCLMWSQCDLSFLPTSDPGFGQPWIMDGHLMVGTPSTVVSRLGLEDASGMWALEAAGSDWLWG